MEGGFCGHKVSTRGGAEEPSLKAENFSHPLLKLIILYVLSIKPY